MATPQKDELSALRGLRDVTALLSTEADPARLLALILDQAIALIGGERGFVILTPPGAPLSVAAARNADRHEIERPDAKVSRSLVQRVVERGRGEVILDAQGEASLRDLTSVRSQVLRSVLCAPLRAAGRVLGVVWVDHRLQIGRFGERDLATLEAFAVPAAAALDAAERVATIERLRAELAERYRARARENDQLKEQVARATSAAAGPGELPGVLGRSPAMRRAAALVRKVAASDVPVLITGESGSGKEVVARAIHALSARREAPFVAENCAALSDPLLESELFGHERGSFTGATGAHAGLFEQARGGTLFLDEVGDMSPTLQPKLLRVLQERELRRVGGSERIPVDVRVLAATHRDLEAAVAAGSFRADLYYRLNVVRIEVPPLRERQDDLPALLDLFLSRFGGERPARLDPQARAMLLAHSWPGNVRELENEVRRLIVLAGPGGEVRPALLSRAIAGLGPVPAPAAPGQDDPDEVPLRGVVPMDAVEREMVRRALRAAGGKKAVAARLLGIPRTTLYHLLERHGERGEDDAAPE